uniref:DUF4218 domain-containing protein n=1 Tax=Strongyloides stercoralis TaxID=6248 RepID=A0A0K0DZW0_STRER
MEINLLINKIELFIDRFYDALFNLFPSYSLSYKFHILLHLPLVLKAHYKKIEFGYQIRPFDLCTNIYESKNRRSKLLVGNSCNYKNIVKTMMFRVSKSNLIDTNSDFQIKNNHTKSFIKSDWNYDFERKSVFTMEHNIDNETKLQLNELSQEIINASFEE